MHLSPDIDVCDQGHCPPKAWGAQEQLYKHGKIEDTTKI